MVLRETLTAEGLDAGISILEGQSEDSVSDQTATRDLQNLTTLGSSFHTVNGVG